MQNYLTQLLIKKQGTEKQIGEVLKTNTSVYINRDVKIVIETLTVIIYST